MTKVICVALNFTAGITVFRAGFAMSILALSWTMIYKACKQWTSSALGSRRNLRAIAWQEVEEEEGWPYRNLWLHESCCISFHSLGTLGENLVNLWKKTIEFCLVTSIFKRKFTEKTLGFRSISWFLEFFDFQGLLGLLEPCFQYNEAYYFCGLLLKRRIKILM